MEFFMAEQIAYHVTEKVRDEWNDREDRSNRKSCAAYKATSSTVEKHRITCYIQSVSAGNIMGNMMAQELMKLLLPPDTIAGIVGNAIERAIKDEEYDREHKEPHEYEIPESRARVSRRSRNGISVKVRVSPLR